MKKPEESEQCDINQLPDSVIDNILTCLPIVEAARTAVLRRNWERGWTNISMLVFDSSFGEKFENAGRANLMPIIWRILFLHLGAIHGFTLSIPWLESCAEINPMIRFLSDKKVKHLKIHFTKGDFHLLPSYLFTCLQLSKLDLTGCELNPPPSFGGFNQLINLYLKEVHITNDFFGMFVSKCPLLQNLRLTYCSFSEVSNINIFAPNLRTFLYEGCKPFICFISVPLLHQLEFYDCDYDYKGG